MAIGFLMLVIFTIICLLGIIIGCFKELDSLIAFSCVGLICVILFGWFGWAGLDEHSSRIEFVPVDSGVISRNSKTLFIQVGERIITSDKHELYSASNECLRVRRHVSINAYGRDIGDEYTIEVFNK
jgi:hypothetical protein